MSFLLDHLNYFAVVVLMMGGLFVVFSSGNLIKRMIGLAIFQTATGLFYISLGKVAGGTAPITHRCGEPGRHRRSPHSSIRPMSRNMASTASSIPIRCRTC